MQSTNREITKEFAARLCAAKGTPITEPGTYETTVTSCNSHRSARNGMVQVAIANFNLTTEYFDLKAKTLFAQGEYQKAANCNLTLGILEGQYRPSPGDEVKVKVVLVHVKANEQTGAPAYEGLFVRKVSPLPAKKVDPVSADQWLQSVEGVEEDSLNMVQDTPAPAIFENIDEAM